MVLIFSSPRVITIWSKMRNIMFSFSTTIAECRSAVATSQGRVGAGELEGRDLCGAERQAGHFGQTTFDSQPVRHPCDAPDSDLLCQAGGGDVVGTFERLPDGLKTSALKGTGIEALREKVHDYVTRRHVDVVVEGDPGNGKLLARLREWGQVREVTYPDGVVRVDVSIAPRYLALIESEGGRVLQAEDA